MTHTLSPDLPPEVSRLITSKLDPETLRSLARVNSTWQAAVEPLLWQKVSLKLEDCPFLARWHDLVDEELGTSVGGWISRNNHQLEFALVFQPHRERYIKALRLLRLASTSPSNAAIALLRPLIGRFDLFVNEGLEPSVEEWLLRRTRKLEAALVNRAIRSSFIEDLHLLATPSTASSLTDILQHTPAIHRLSIGLPEIDGRSNHFHLRCRDNASILLRAFTNLPPFNHLLDLSVRITQNQWSEFWQALPRIAPNLVRLDVDMFLPVEAPLVPEADTLVVTPALENFVATTTPETFDCLVRLIHHTATLQRVHLRGRLLDRSPLDSQAMTVFSSCNVRWLSLAFNDQATNTVWHNMLRQPGAFKSVEELTVGFPDNWSPWVPPLPNLQTLVYTHMEWPETDGYGCTTSIVHPDEREEFFAILEECAAEILRAPKLGTLIKLGEWFEDLDYTGLTHEEWIRHRIRVRLFRSYHRGNDTLLHMRELEWRKTVFATKRDVPHVCPDAGCDEHYWTHATCFNGNGVDSETLIAIYRMTGQDIDWFTPGRGLKLPNQAWELLQA